jgi:hypothetical protein
MKKLEDIPKTNIFKVPEGYFEKLPHMIQAKVVKQESNWTIFFQYSLKFALPILIVTLGAVWFMSDRGGPGSTEQTLASISTVDLEEYIHESEMHTEDLLESIDFSKINADSLDLYDWELPLNEIDWIEIENGIETEI